MDKIQITDDQITLKGKLEHGDVKKIAVAVGKSTKTIHNVMNGLRKGQYVWDAMSQMLQERAIKRSKKVSSLNSSC